ncbi:MAG: amino acid racemase [Calditrichaceae bacterium]|nr:amino acid racemase [Calditrichaceae bacterium]
MKKIGIIGGLGPESTLDYYKGIIDAFKADYEQTGYPEICIESVDLKTFVGYANNDEWDKVIRILAEKSERLKNIGCEFGVIASNTPHRVFNKIAKKTTLPLISIVETTCYYASILGLKKLCLLGTRFTMSSDFYQKVFEKKGIELVVPDKDEQDYIQEKLFSEIEFGIIRAETRHGLLKIYERILQDDQVEGLVLGCTELPLIIKPEHIEGAYIDPVAIHIEKIVEYCRS